MKIKNIGGKIISLGMLTLLPGEVASLPKDFENNTVVEHFVDMGLVELEESVKADKPDKANSQPDRGEQKPGDEKTDDDNDNGGEQEPADDNNSDDGEKPAPKPGTTKTGRGGRNK